MKRYKYLICALLLATCLISCGDDDIAPGNPVMKIKTDFTPAMFGDSLAFSFSASDQEVPLSTLKAQLFYGEELVSESVIRAKTNSEEYAGKIYVPYYADIANGNATLKFTLQNIHFTITEEEYNLPLSRPDFPYLTLVTRDSEYRMERVGLYKYEVTGEFPQSMRSYIRAPKVGEHGNEITFGWGDEKSIVENEEGWIPFSGSGAEYTIAFNTLTYEADPFLNIVFNGEEMQLVDNNIYQVEKSIEQGEEIKITGIEGFESWWINPDYFSKDENGTITFIPLEGRYRVKADLSIKYLKVEKLNGTELATLDTQGHGALWILGWGIGVPSLDYQFSWNEGYAYCISEVESKIYRMVLVAGPEAGSRFGQTVRTNYIDCKLFYQNAWGGEFESIKLAAGSEAYLSVTASNNLELAKDVTLEEDQTYILTIDLTDSVDNPVVSFVKE